MTTVPAPPPPKPAVPAEEPQLDLPPRSPAQDAAVAARYEGHQWSDIHAFVNSGITEAQSEGYAPEAIDTYLGQKPPPAGALHAHALRAVGGASPVPTGYEAGSGQPITTPSNEAVLPPAANTAAIPPDPMKHAFIAGGMGLGDPTKQNTVQPTDTGMAFRVAQHAGLEGVTPTLDPTKPLQQDLGGTLPDPIRHAYSEALSNHEVAGPGDFSEAYWGAVWNAARTSVDGAEYHIMPAITDQSAWATAGAKSLASRLPSNEDFSDIALAVASSSGQQPTPGLVAIARDNLIRHWADTGESPMDAWHRSQQDAGWRDDLLQPRMILPQRAPVPADPPDAPAAAQQWWVDPDAQGAVAAAGGLKILAEGAVAAGGDVKDLVTGLAQSMTPEAYMASERKLLSGDMTAQEAAGFMSQHFLGGIGEDGVPAPSPYADRAASAITGRVLKDLFADTSGSVRVPNVFLTPGQQTIQADSLAAGTWGRQLMQEQRGLAKQAVAVASARFEQYRGAVAKALPEYHSWLDQGAQRSMTNLPALAHMLNYIEGYSKGAVLHPSAAPFAPLADALRDVVQTTRGSIQATIPNMTSFIDDYYRHLWTQPQNVASALGVGRTGSSASLHARSLPTMMDGLARGLTPRIADPIENTLHYVAGMQNYLSNYRVLDRAEADGYVQYAASTPTAGWLPLNGRLSQQRAVNGSLMRAYAPADLARSYNNWIGRGFYDWPRAGAVYDKLLRSTNAMTASKLALSAYHAWNISKETLIGGLGTGIGQVARGDLANGLANIGMSGTILPKLAQQYARGGRLQGGYLQLPGASPTDLALGDIMSHSGMSPLGRADVYRAGVGPNLVQQFKRGTAAFELKHGLSQIAGDPLTEAPATRAAMAPLRAVGFAGHQVGQALDLAMGPLFDKLIPRVKAATWADEMESWLRANPNAARDDVVAQGQKLSNSMDDRFGEMNQDNLFWHPLTKQFANLAFVSVGWEFGTLRAFGGAAKDLMHGEFNSTRSRWLLSFVLGTAAESAVYQYLKTGQGPSSLADYATPQSGGRTPYGAPERAILPGYQKDVAKWYNALATAHGEPMAMAQNAWRLVQGDFNPGMQLGDSLITNEDWAGRPVHVAPAGSYGRPPTEMQELASAWHDYSNLVVGAAEPIAAQMPRLRGSQISELEHYLGERAAPEWIEDPRRVAAWQAYREKLERRQAYMREMHEKAREAQ